MSTDGGNRARRAALAIVRDREDRLRDGDFLHGEQLCFGYGKADAPVIAGARLQARRDALTCIHGPHESGKTTLGSLLALDLTPTSGAVRIDRRPAQPEDLALVSFPPTDDWPVEETPLDFLANKFRAEGFAGSFLAPRFASDVLKEAGLWHLAKEDRRALSHFDRARVGTLGKLVGLPGWLILDDLESRLSDSDASKLVDFVLRAAQPCRVGVVWLTSTVKPYLAADQTYSLRNGSVTETAA